MDDKQLEEIIQYAENGWFDTEIAPVTYAPAFVAARADLAAKRQPITAESLRAAGWKESSVERIWDYPSDQWDALWQIQVVTQDDGSLERVRNIDGYSINASTMYDLGELVRLLGGASQ